VPETVPTVQHHKRAGWGYKDSSPLSERQEDVWAERLERGDEVVRGPVPPVSTTMLCVIVLTAQFFILYTVLFVLQTLNRLELIDRKREERCWASVVESVFFVPMLCILFLATRLRAVQLARGQPDRYGLPQWWVKAAMVLCTWSVLLTVIAQACIELFGELQEASARGRWGPAGRLAKICRNVVLTGIYVCFTAVCVGVCNMEGPLAVWGHHAAPLVSPAVACTVFLTVTYFAVYLALACVRLANELGLLGERLRFCQALEYLKSATTAVVFAPMLCALFIAARLRALQLDPVYGNPQPWVQLFFYLCSACVVFQTILAVAGTFLGMHEQQPDLFDNPGHQRWAAGAKSVTRTIETARLVLMACLYLGVLAIILGIHIEEPPGGVPAPTFSLTLRCITLLAALYFGVYLAHAIVLMAQRSAPMVPGNRRSDAVATLEVFLGILAKEAVGFCPKFCILYIATLVRSQQLTDGRGAPQLWCQVVQCLASGCIVLLAVVRVDVVLPRAPRQMAATLTAVQYACLVLLYASAIAIVVSLFTLTPQNAVGYGALAAAAAA